MRRSHGLPPQVKSLWFPRQGISAVSAPSSTWRRTWPRSATAAAAGTMKACRYAHTHTHRSMTHTALQVGNTSYSFVCWQKYYQKHKQRPPKPSATSSDWSEPSTEMKHSSQLLAVRRCKNVCLAKTSETLFNRFAVWFFENVCHIVIMLTHTVYTHTHIHKTRTYKDLSFCYSTE